MSPTSPGLAELQGSLASAFGDCSPQGAPQLTPHLSLGQFSKPAAAERAAQACAPCLCVPCPQTLNPFLLACSQILAGLQPGGRQPLLNAACARC